MTVLVLGSINIDLTTYVPRLPVAGETLFGRSFMTVPGGKGFNQAVAAGRLGAETRFFGRIGNDSFGKELLQLSAFDGKFDPRLLASWGGKVNPLLNSKKIMCFCTFP